MSSFKCRHTWLSLLAAQIPNGHRVHPLNSVLPDWRDLGNIQDCLGALLTWRYLHLETTQTPRGKEGAVGLRHSVSPPFDGEDETVSQTVAASMSTYEALRESPVWTAWQELLTTGAAVAAAASKGASGT